MMKQKEIREIIALNENQVPIYSWTKSYEEEAPNQANNISLA